MKITPESLRALTKKLALENKKTAKRLIKEETDGDINAIDALKELEQYAMDDEDEVIGSDTDDQVSEPNDDSEEDGKEIEIVDGDSDDEPEETASEPVVDYDLDGLKTVDVDADATIELGADDSEDDEDGEPNPATDDEDEDEEDEDEDEDEEDDSEVELIDDKPEDEGDFEELDENALTDLFKHFGEGIKGILKLCGKGLLVVIAGLGGSFLFGLPGLLIAVMIAFGLLTNDKVTAESKIKVNEGILASVKDKIKTVCKILKADPKKAKEINDKVLAAKKTGDKKAIQAAADEVKALVNDDEEVTEDGDDSLFDLVVSQHTAFRNAIGLGVAFKKFVGNDANVTDDNGSDSAGTKDGLWITVSDVDVSGDKVSGKAKIGDGEPQEFEVIIGNLKKVLTDANAVDGFEYHMEDVINAIVKCAGVIKEKHGDKNNRGWRKNKKPVKESDQKFKDFKDVEVGDRGEDYAGLEGTIKAIGTVGKFKNFWTCDIEDLTDMGFDEDYPAVLVELDEEPGEKIAYVYDDEGGSGFLAYDTDSIEVSEEGDLGAKLDQLDADELKKLNPDQKEKLQDILTVDEDDEKHFKCSCCGAELSDDEVEEGPDGKPCCAKCLDILGEESNKVVIPPPYDKYFTIAEYDPEDMEDEEYKIGDEVEGMKILAYLDTVNSGAALLTDDEDYPVVQIIAGRVYPYDEDDLDDLTPIDAADEYDECDEGDEVTSPQQIVEFLKESQVVKSDIATKHAARRYLKMVKESPMKAKLVAKQLNKKFGNKPVKESRFCRAFTKIVL